MSYVDPGPCRSKFTLGQAKRIHAYLTTASILSGIQPQITINNPPSNITYWNTPQSPSANILIPTGQRLVINDVVQMSPGTHIYVEKGASLYVNSTITATCDEMWQGIIVQGDRDLTQTPANQGYVRVNTSGIIEHAICGIKAEGLLSTGAPDPAGGGGIIFTALGKIRNCITGVKYELYLKESSHSRFYFTDFTVDNNYRGGNAKPVFMDLKSTYGIQIHYGLFKDERTTCNGREGRAIGIRAYDAGFHISDGSLFESLDYGIRASTLKLSSGIFFVTGSTFQDCFTGIYTTLADGYLIDGNTFNFDRPDACDNIQKVALVGINSTAKAVNIQISNNTMIPADSQDPLESFIGTDCFELGTKNNEIFNNSFIALNVGNRAHGENGISSSENMIYSGLLYECNMNDYTNSEGDFLVSEGRIRMVQGEEIGSDPTTTIAAGNTFSGYFFFKNIGDSDIRYYYTTGAGEDPGSATDSPGITKILADESNPNCGEPEQCPKPPCIEQLPGRKIQFTDAKQDWKDKVEAFPSVIGTPQKVAAGHEISQLRLDMDRNGRYILQQYQLDTIEIEIDSVLTWLGNLETYESDYHVARHHFFTGAFASADTIFSHIPARYGLTDARLDAFEDIIEVLDILRPHLLLAGSMYELPDTILTDLEDYDDRCDEAGYLARELLGRNGIERTVDCEGTASRPSPQRGVSKLNAVDGLLIFPNPASETLTINSREVLVDFSLSNLTGQIIKKSELPIDVYGFSLPVRDIKQGIYFLKIVSSTGNSSIVKVAVQR